MPIFGRIVNRPQQAPSAAQPTEQRPRHGSTASSTTGVQSTVSDLDEHYGGKSDHITSQKRAYYEVEEENSGGPSSAADSVFYRQATSSSPPPGRSQQFSAGHDLGWGAETAASRDSISDDIRRSLSTSRPKNSREGKLDIAGDVKKSRGRGLGNYLSTKIKETKEKLDKTQTQTLQTDESATPAAPGCKISKNQRKGPTSLPHRKQDTHAGHQSGEDSDLQPQSPLTDTGEGDRYCYTHESQPISPQRSGYDSSLRPQHSDLRFAALDRSPTIPVLKDDSHCQYLLHQGAVSPQQDLHRPRHRSYTAASAEISSFEDFDKTHASHASTYRLNLPSGHEPSGYTSPKSGSALKSILDPSYRLGAEDRAAQASRLNQAPYPSSPADHTSIPAVFPEESADSAQLIQMPPPLPNNLNRRSTDAKSALGFGDVRGLPPSYAQQHVVQSRGDVGSPNPTIISQAVAGRPSSVQRDYSVTSEQGRSAPSSEKGIEAQEYDKLMTKYKKVKGLYFEKNAQVESLRDTLANQRITQSRTFLDDNEYITRFNRLDGAIKEFAHSIRKEWTTIPLWLTNYVNADANTTGTKEMIAVGRAVISRWLYDEVFCRCFHPGLEIELSADLKKMERNIRALTASPVGQEEESALSSKVVAWKLASIDALADRITGPKAVETIAAYSLMATNNLTAHLAAHLVKPTPLGIEGNATSIIQLAVGICSHLAKESREISINYPLPDELVGASGMKLEAGLPALMVSINDRAAAGAKISGEKVDEDAYVGSRVTQEQNAENEGSVANGRQIADSQGCARIRFAGFVNVEIKGRQWLVTAPIWTY